MEKQAQSTLIVVMSHQTAFKALRLIVTVGWAIYPIGYLMGYFGEVQTLQT